MDFKNSGKMKAVTFSFDDGIVQDYRMIELLNKYGLKATFNLSSGLFGKSDVLWLFNKRLCHYYVHADRVKCTYEGHEVAAHGVHHPHLAWQDADEIVAEVEGDRLALSELVGYEVVGLAYPFGSVDDRVEKVLRERTGIKYARQTPLTSSFDVPQNLMRLNGTMHMIRFDEMMDLGRKFIELETEEPKIFYVWGHCYEMDYESENWVRMEEFFKLISGHDDIYYGTNKDVLL